MGKVYRSVFVKDEDIGAISRTSAEDEKAKRIKKSARGAGVLFTRGFLLNLLFTVSLTAVAVWLFVVVNSGETVLNSFDPFQILDVDAASDLKAIKKAYKTMRLKWHPNNNPNNPAAEAKFMMVAKAYEALTDPAAKDNYEKYGNPDGKQSLQVSIGLPSFLLDTDNRNVVLMVYLIVMVGVIPFCVWRYYSDSSKFGEKDVMYDTYAWYHHNLNEHTLMKSLPEVYAGSAEFRAINLIKNESDRNSVSKSMRAVRAYMQKPKYNHPVCVTGNVLMHSHLLRKTDDLTPELQSNLDRMLRQSSTLIDAMITVCQHQESLNTALNCIKFGQSVTQALWTKDSTLLQLPHFTETEAEHSSRGKKASARAGTLAEYLDVEDDEKKGLADFSDVQRDDVLRCCRLLPRLEVTTGVYVDDDEDKGVYEGDLCTVRVTLKRKPNAASKDDDNVKRSAGGGKSGSLVHAPRFPFPRTEGWWVVLGTKEGKIVSIEKVAAPKSPPPTVSSKGEDDPKNEEDEDEDEEEDDPYAVKHDIKFLAPRTGEYEFDLHVLSDSYVGLDSRSSVKLATLDPSVLPEYKIHPDDAELDDEPTLFEEMMNANVEEDSDSDDDDSDSEDDDEDGSDSGSEDGEGGGKGGIRELSASERKKEELRNARKRATKASGEGDDDDDSDSDDSENEVEEVYAEK